MDTLCKAPQTEADRVVRHYRSERDRAEGFGWDRALRGAGKATRIGDDSIRRSHYGELIRLGKQPPHLPTERRNTPGLPAQEGNLLRLSSPTGTQHITVGTRTAPLP